MTCGHQSLSIFVRLAPNLLSAVDPGSLVRKLTSLRLPPRYLSKTICSLYKKSDSFESDFLYTVAGPRGIEPRPLVLETSILPLNYRPV